MNEQAFMDGFVKAGLAKGLDGERIKSLYHKYAASLPMIQGASMPSFKFNIPKPPKPPKFGVPSTQPAVFPSVPGAK